jgi:hypothetical protein
MLVPPPFAVAPIASASNPVLLRFTAPTAHAAHTAQRTGPFLSALCYCCYCCCLPGAAPNRDADGPGYQRPPFALAEALAPPTIHQPVCYVARCAPTYGALIPQHTPHIRQSIPSHMAFLLRAAANSLETGILCHPHAASSSCGGGRRGRLPRESLRSSSSASPSAHQKPASSLYDLHCSRDLLIARTRCLWRVTTNQSPLSPLPWFAKGLRGLQASKVQCHV